MLSNAAASELACSLGEVLSGGISRYFGSTPAASCEKFFVTPSGNGYLAEHRTVVTADPHKSNYLQFDCVAATSQATIDQYLNEDESIVQGTFTRLNGQCFCRQGTAYSNPSGTEAGCKTIEKILTLTTVPQTPPDPRPKGTEGKDPKSSTLELIAKVTENGNPKAGVAVTFAVEVAANSGGHDHHDASRPKGEVKANSLTTDAKGEIKVTFEASKVAGKHVVAAVCSSCSNSSVTKNVDVKVPDLVPLSDDSSVPPRFKLIGNTGSVGSKHLGNHYFSAEALEAFSNVLTVFAKHKWGQVGVNDASLIWGGKFDLGLRWGAAPTGGREESHQGHRTGDELDISFINPAGISADKRRKVYDDLYESEDVDMPEVLWHEFDNPATGSKAHFHLYLLSQKPSSIIKY